MTHEEQMTRYFQLAHAMQSGVAFAMEASISDDISPKHLRVGVNSSLVEGSAVAKLLMAKGIFTEEEYFDALIQGFEEEVARYEKLLSDHYGREITLG